MCIFKQPICAHVHNIATVYAGNAENEKKGEKRQWHAVIVDIPADP